MGRLDDIAVMFQAGLASRSQEDELWIHARNICLSLAAEYAKSGQIRWPDREDVVQETLAKTSAEIGRWDPSIGRFTTYLRKIMLTSVRKQQAQYRADTKSVVAAVELAWEKIQASPEIASNPDAMAEWDEQVGRWMADGIMPDSAALAKLRHDLVTAYRLFGKWRESK